MDSYKNRFKRKFLNDNKEMKTYNMEKNIEIEDKKTSEEYNNGAEFDNSSESEIEENERADLASDNDEGDCEELSQEICDEDSDNDVLQIHTNEKMAKDDEYDDEEEKNQDASNSAGDDDDDEVDQAMENLKRPETPPQRKIKQTKVNKSNSSVSKIDKEKLINEEIDKKSCDEKKMKRDIEKQKIKLSQKQKDAGIVAGEKKAASSAINNKNTPLVPQVKNLEKQKPVKINLNKEDKNVSPVMKSNNKSNQQYKHSMISNPKRNSSLEDNKAPQPKKICKGINEEANRIDDKKNISDKSGKQGSLNNKISTNKVNFVDFTNKLPDNFKQHVLNAMLALKNEFDTKIEDCHNKIADVKRSAFDGSGLLNSETIHTCQKCNKVFIHKCPIDSKITLPTGMNNRKTFEPTPNGGWITCHCPTISYHDCPALKREYNQKSVSEIKIFRSAHTTTSKYTCFDCGHYFSTIVHGFGKICTNLEHKDQNSAIYNKASNYVKSKFLVPRGLKNVNLVQYACVDECCMYFHICNRPANI